jgi:uncharacterized protein YndB with AHSA1/START domain
MPWFLWIPVGLGTVVGAWAIFVFTAKIEAPGEARTAIALGSAARKLEGTRYLEYRIGVTITAAPEKVWALLTNAAAFPQWNSEVLGIEGTIALGEKIKLKAKIAPDRTFPLRVSAFEPGRKLVWEDGNKIFKGVRTFTLTPNADGTTAVTMAEVLTGAFLPMIAPKLPDFRPSFDNFAADLKRAAEA